jgi:hypothetical protein
MAVGDLEGRWFGGSLSSFCLFVDLPGYVSLVPNVSVLEKKIFSNESGTKDVFRPSPNRHRDLTLDDHVWRG